MGCLFLKLSLFSRIRILLDFFIDHEWRLGPVLLVVVLTVPQTAKSDWYRYICIAGP